MHAVGYRDGNKGFARIPFPANAVVCLSEGELSTRWSTRSTRWANLLTILREPSSARSGNVELNLQDALKRFLKITVASVATALVLVYAGDCALFRYRSASNRIPYGSIAVGHHYAVQHKNGKTEFLFDAPTAQICVHSEFPHGGHTPCWYLVRHIEPRTDI